MIDAAEIERLVEQSAVAKVWPRSVADHAAEHLTPKQIEMLYAAADWAFEAADALTALIKREGELREALEGLVRQHGCARIAPECRTSADERALAAQYGE